MLSIHLIKEVAWRWATCSYLLFSGALPLGPSNIWQRQKWEGPFSFLQVRPFRSWGCYPEVIIELVAKAEAMASCLRVQGFPHFILPWS